MSEDAKVYHLHYSSSLVPLSSYPDSCELASHALLPFTGTLFSVHIKYEDYVTSKSHQANFSTAPVMLV